jgi:hypothetical protein
MRIQTRLKFANFLITKMTSDNENKKMKSNYSPSPRVGKAVQIFDPNICMLIRVIVGERTPSGEPRLCPDVPP